MTDMNKINVEALENVAGGYEKHTVHNDARRSRRTAMYGTRSCSPALMTQAGSQVA